MSEKLIDDFLAACMQNRLEIVKKMIFDDRFIVRKQDMFGWTGLMWAVQFNTSSIVDIILSTPGVIISQQNIYGMTALHCACENNSVESVKLLLQHPQCSQEFIYVFTKTYETARMVSERKGHLECEKILQDYLILQDVSHPMKPVGKNSKTCDRSSTSIQSTSSFNIFNTFNTGQYHTSLQSSEPASSMHNFNTGRYHTSLQSFEPSAPPMASSDFGQIVSKPLSTGLKIPECYVCFEEMRPPLRIKSCKEGHALCEQCLERMKPKRCGQCKSVSFGRATTLEQFIKNILDIE